MGPQTEAFLREIDRASQVARRALREAAYAGRCRDRGEVGFHRAAMIGVRFNASLAGELMGDVSRKALRGKAVVPMTEPARVVH
jgi:hypothetical protein